MQRDKATTRPLTTTWVVEKRSGIVKARLCLRPFGRPAKYTKDELYSPTPLGATMKALLVRAHVRGDAIVFFDVSRAFLHTPIRNDSVFVEPPPEAELPVDVVWWLRCAAYGLEESMVDFDTHFENVVCGRVDDTTKAVMTFVRLVSDPSVYVERKKKCAMSKHVDDGLVTGPKADVAQTLVELKQHFLLKVTDYMSEGQTEKYLGRFITRIATGFSIKCNPALIASMAELLGLSGLTTAVPTPGVKTDARVEGEEALDEAGAKLYRTVCGKLMFVALERVDVQYAAKECSRGMSKPTKGDFVRIKRVVRYLKTTAHFEQFLEPQLHARNVVRGPVDSDWANDKIERKSTSSGQIYYIEALILAWARTQAVQALSSGEAESYALGTGACECLAVKSVLTELDEEVEVVLESDSSAAISSQSRLGMGRMKHVQIKYMFLQQMVKSKLLSLKKVPGTENTADIGTKYLEKATFEKLRLACGLRDPEVVVASIQEETRGKTNGWSQATDGMRTCLMGLLLMLQVGGTRGSKTPQSYLSILLLPLAAAEQEENETNLYPLSWLLLVTLIAGASIPVLIYFVTKGCTRPTVLMTMARRDKGTQCNRKVTDVMEIEKLTIEAIKKELAGYGAPQTGVKNDLVSRLARYREALNSMRLTG